MRNFLLAATAIAALAGASAAQAQTPVTNGRASWVGGPFSAGAPSNGEDPGAPLKVYLRSRLWFDAVLVGDSGDQVGGSKSQAQGIGTFARLYPSFEGVTANGLKYGAFLEVRHNGGGNGVGPNSGTATLYFRRETGYIGGSWGQLRFGAADGPLGLFMVGTFENFDLGGSWNGDLPSFTNSAVNPTWTMPENGGDYTNEKIVYVSPSFGGFDFGFSYEPNGSGSGESNNAFSSAGSLRLASVGGGTFAGNIPSLRRARNAIQFGGRYQGTLGPVGVQLEAVGYTAGLVGNNGLTGLSAGGAPQYKFKTPLALDVGAIVTYGGFATGFNVWSGAVNPDGSRNTAPVIKGGINTLDYTVGASYAFGSYIVGANAIVNNRQGVNWQDVAASAAGIGRMHEFGMDVGGTYAWGPGAAASLSYYYGERHQNGVNLYTSAAGKAGNNTHAQGVILTQFFSW